MIRGQVKRNEYGGLEPWVTVSVQDAAGTFRPCRVILDTGFTGALTLPATVVRELGLVNEGHRPVVTASGQSEDFEYYSAWVSWHDNLYDVGVFESIDQPLLGMELLEGSHVTIDASEGGDVIIGEAPP